MDALHGWCPDLESLRVIGNPLTEGVVNHDIIRNIDNQGAYHQTLAMHDSSL